MPITDERELGRKRAELPTLIGLCPLHAEYFYMPLDQGGSVTCPECPVQMSVYAPVGEPARHVIHRTAVFVALALAVLAVFVWGFVVGTWV